MAYLTVAELKEKSFIGEIINAPVEDDSLLEALIAICSKTVDAYVGYPFVQETGITLYMDGDGNNRLAPQKRILSITSISTIDQAVTYNNSDLKITGDVRRRILNSAESFEDGVDNIVIVGDFGWATVPEDVQDAVALLCNSTYVIITDSSKIGIASGPFTSEKIGDYSYTLDKRYNIDTGTKLDSTGNLEVDLILDKYRIEFSIGVI